MFRNSEEIQIKPTNGAKEIVNWIQANIENSMEDSKKPQIKFEIIEENGSENYRPKIEFQKNVEFRQRIYKKLKELPIILPKKMENLQNITIKCIKVLKDYNILFYIF